MQKNDMYLLTSIRDYYEKQLTIRYAYNSWKNQYFVSLTWNEKKIEILYYSNTLFNLQNLKKKIESWINNKHKKILIYTKLEKIQRSLN